MRTILISGAAALAALVGAASIAHAQPADGGKSCFRSNEWSGWTPTANGQAINLRVGIKDIYRVDFGPGARITKMPGDFLVSQVRGSSWICKPIDLDLTLSDNLGVKRPLIATGLHKLTPEEAAALPKSERP